MTSTIIAIALGIVVLGGLVFIAIRYGKSKMSQKQAEEVAHDLEEDSKIDSEPYVDDPLDRM